jgi:hypothetical protein
LLSGKIFGVPLEQVAVLGVHEGLPYVVAKAMDILEENGILLEGIFRISGNMADIAAAKEKFDSGQDVNLALLNPHCVAGLLKLYFRELPEPLLRFELYEIFVAIFSMLPTTKRRHIVPWRWGSDRLLTNNIGACRLCTRGISYQVLQCSGGHVALSKQSSALALAVVLGQGRRAFRCQQNGTVEYCNR